MPVYTYRCTNCGFVFDQHQKFSESSLTKCPECEKKTLQKVFQPVGIVFKGSGFYSTDHRSPSGQGRTTTTPKPSESSESSDKSDRSERSDRSEKTPASEKTTESPSKSSSSSEK
jgi:putative FmdB family regulatory protein